jgi:hypothetical protein
MKNRAAAIDRLFRAACAAPDEPLPAMPFGFDTRVIAQWRATWPNDPAGVARLLRRVMLLATALIVLGSAGAYREYQQSEELFGDEYAFADTAIGGVFNQ